MEVVIVNESSFSVPRKFINQWLSQVVSELKRRRVWKVPKGAQEITLVFLDKKAAKKLNHEFRGKDYATDVLSFDSVEPGSLGELIMCPEVLKRQAKEHKLTYQQELGYMLLHGVLHLLGYDHETSPEDERKMFSIQDAVFEKLLQK